jgi:hypothetical protein
MALSGLWARQCASQYDLPMQGLAQDGDYMLTQEEEMALRELAAGRCTTQAVIDVLGPLSLWSKQSFEAEIQKAVETGREQCALLLEDYERFGDTRDCIAAIRAMGNK